MKTIVVYSGKGGVGKTTVSTMLALSLSKKNKVLLFDADINTPSLLHLFEDKKFKNLEVESVASTTPVGKSGVKTILRSLKTKVEAGKYDVLIMDTPPSITPVHEALFEELSPSGVVYVSTPDKLSLKDLDVGRIWVENLGVKSLGCVLNMVGKEDVSEIDLNMPLLATVPRSPKYDSESISASWGKILDLDLATIENGGFNTEINGEVEALLMDKRSFSDLNWNDGDDDYDDGKKLSPIYIDPGTGKRLTLNKFVNLKTWDRIANLLNKGPISDGFLTNVTNENLTKMVKRFTNTRRALMMVKFPPGAEEETMPFEILECDLLLNEKSHHGVPRVRTSFGLVLFSYEIYNIPEEEILDLMRSPDWEKVGQSRYLPTRNSFLQLMNMYGGFYENYYPFEEYYDKTREIIRKKGY